MHHDRKIVYELKFHERYKAYFYITESEDLMDMFIASIL
jgi:hypothetical protein